MLVQSDEATLLGPEVITSTGQEIPGGDFVSGRIGSGEWGAVDGELDEARSGSSRRVVLEFDVLGNLNERGDNLTVELGNLGDDTLEGLPEITSREGEVYDGVAEGYGVEDPTKRDISSIDRGAVSTGVGDGCVSVGSTIPLHGVGDGITEVAFAKLAIGFVEENIGLSNNLIGKFAKGNGPFEDLGLELRVDGSGVVHVDRATGILDDSALVVEANVESTKVFTPPVGSDNEDLLAIQVLLNRGVGTQSTSEVSEGSVGVTADDEVETPGVLGKFLVPVVTNVGHGNDALGQLPLHDVIDGFLHSLGDVEELSSGAGAGDSGSSLGGDTDNCKVVLLEDLVGLDVLHELGIVALDIGANSWEGQVFQLESQVR